MSQDQSSSSSSPPPLSSAATSSSSSSLFHLLSSLVEFVQQHPEIEKLINKTFASSSSSSSLETSLSLPSFEEFFVRKGNWFIDEPSEGREGEGERQREEATNACEYLKFCLGLVRERLDVALGHPSSSFSSSSSTTPSSLSVIDRDRERKEKQLQQRLSKRNAKKKGQSSSSSSSSSTSTPLIPQAPCISTSLISTSSSPLEFQDILSAEDSRVSELRISYDSELRRRGLFIVESRWPIQRLLQSSSSSSYSSSPSPSLTPRFRIKYIVTTPSNRDWLLSILSSTSSSLPSSLLPSLYLTDSETLKLIVGFEVHRGCVAVVERPPSHMSQLSQILSSSASPSSSLSSSHPWFETQQSIRSYILSRTSSSSTTSPPSSSSSSSSLPLPPSSSQLIVILERVANPENVGAIFRSALALGATCVFLSPTCTDPLYRKSIRASMGAVLKLPFVWMDCWPLDLKNLTKEGDYEILALTPAADAIPLSKVMEEWKEEEEEEEEEGKEIVKKGRGRKVALLLGHEGDGISQEAAVICQRRVRVEMTPHSADSLNVSACAAATLYSLSLNLGILSKS